MLQDGDTYWHIAAGQWIIGHAAVPTSDPFSHTMQGAPWTAHEWLSETIFALTWKAFGWGGLIALTAAAFAATMAMLTRFLLKNLEPVHALIFTALAVMMTAPHLLVRPHALAMPLLVLWTAQLVRGAERGRAPSYWMLPVMTLWANLHGGFTLGLALTLFFAVEGVLGARRASEALVAVKSWSIFICLAVASALLTPHGIQGILFTAHIMSGNYALDHISEWQSPSFHLIQPLEIWLMAGLAIALHQGLRLPALRLLLLLALLHLALKHMRSIELIGLLTPLFLAVPLAAQWRERTDTTRQLVHVDRIFLNLAGTASRRATALMLAGLGLVTLVSVQTSAALPPEDISPITAIKTARKAALNGPVLNEYSFGGYLVYAGIPPFIDGRADMYGDEFMKAYFDALDLTTSDGLQELLQKHHIEWTLLPPGSAAVAMLDHLPGWHRLYADRIAVIHVRSPAAAGERKP
ncbi:MAG TPA: hypothetical protein VFP33_12015 [Gallionella sp.]|nr:hypothetical protein [Gallionella sp.]